MSTCVLSNGFHYMHTNKCKVAYSEVNFNYLLSAGLPLVGYNMNS